MIKAVLCCRAHCLFRSLSDGEVPLCRSWGTEVYRLIWDSSFDGDTVVRIGRLGDEIRLSRLHRPSHFARPERGEASLMPCDWARVQEAVIATNFWALDPAGEQRGLDGAFWTIEGRRKDIFHAVHRGARTVQFTTLAGYSSHWPGNRWREPSSIKLPRDAGGSAGASGGPDEKRKIGMTIRPSAMPNGRCRIHGGRSPGAPRGERNGRWRGGFYTPEAKAERRRLRALIRQMRETMDELP